MNITETFNAITYKTAAMVVAVVVGGGERRGGGGVRWEKGRGLGAGERVVNLFRLGRRPLMAYSLNIRATLCDSKTSSSPHLTPTFCCD